VVRSNRARRPTGPDKLTVEALIARAEGRCEIGGEELYGERGEGWHVHHRRPRGMGSTKRHETNAIESLLLLCPDHHEHLESRRSEAYAKGWLVRQNEHPAAVPVVVRDQLVVLTDDAAYRPVRESHLPEVNR
jgi:5-methylcytosine-specific restriction protein A